MNILVVYSCSSWPLRATTRNHLYFLRTHTRHRVFYLNAAVRRIPWYLRRIPFDLILFDTLFLNRWNRDAFRRTVDRVAELARHDAVRAALPQDEFINTDLLCDFVNALAIDVVFTVAPESEWANIYRTVERPEVQYHRVLTGYLDERTLRSIESTPPPERSIDIGYKTAGRPYAWFGRHGYLKQEIAERFLESAPSRGLRLDITTHDGNTILGNRWFEFLRSCRFTIGVEGGTSILDRDGSIHERTLAYVRAHPEATFEEIEAACFPGLDGTFKLFAISPRHLEACATSTCQILTSGDYNGILRPGEHYIELEHDFSNLEEVLDAISDEPRRREIAERAHADIVASGKYSYRSLAETILQRASTLSRERGGRTIEPFTRPCEAQ